jgi:hypothetical protein
MSRENETGLTDDKITAYQIFGWVPLALFFIAAGTTALIGVLNVDRLGALIVGEAVLG